MPNSKKTRASSIIIDVDLSSELSPIRLACAHLPKIASFLLVIVVSFFVAGHTEIGILVAILSAILILPLSFLLESASMRTLISAKRLLRVEHDAIQIVAPLGAWSGSLTDCYWSIGFTGDESPSLRECRSPAVIVSWPPHGPSSRMICAVGDDVSRIATHLSQSGVRRSELAVPVSPIYRGVIIFMCALSGGAAIGAFLTIMSMLVKVSVAHWCTGTQGQRTLNPDFRGTWAISSL